MNRLFILLFVSVSHVWGSACAGHGGYMRCGASGFSVCQDGTLDKRAPCSWKRPRERELKFKKRPDRGQVLTPGETPPDTTLKESYRELKDK